jgi:1,4-alpha-glucan branching enzyme
MEAAGRGVFEATTTEAPPGTRYWVERNGTDRFPDPASRFQPEGVHGSSQVVDPSRYTWHDADWASIDRADLVIYELHVGTFTDAGTFEGVRRFFIDNALHWLGEYHVDGLRLDATHALHDDSEVHQKAAREAKQETRWITRTPITRRTWSGTCVA